MKKWTKLLSLCLLTGIMTAGGAVAGCSHRHTYEEKWSSDGEKHWHAATCEHGDEKGDEGEHEFGDDDICDICNYNRATTVAVQGVSLDKTTADIAKGATLKLIATIAPANATNKNRSWSSDNEAVATVSDSGVVTAVGEGTATITVTTEDGGKTATCAVTVTDNTIAVTGVSLNKASASIVIGDSLKLIAEIAPSNATDLSRTWSSSNTEVATVSPEGVVSALKAGTTTIMVSAANGEFTATCIVTVTEKAVAVTGITLDKSVLNLKVGDVELVTATVAPANATNKERTRKSSNEAVATVDASGNVRAVGVGTAVITVKTVDGGFEATCTVNVTAKTIAVEKIELRRQTLELEVGDTDRFEPIFTPANATNQKVTYKSSNTSVATTDGNQIKAVGVGTTTITVTTEDGNKTATCEVTVKERTKPVVHVTGISLDHTEVTLKVDETQTVIATVTPSDATDKSRTRKSSDDTVATVDEYGVITAHKEGTAVITVTTVDGEFEATCTVTVLPKTIAVESVDLERHTLALKVGQTDRFHAIITPADATNKTVTYESSDPTIVKIIGDEGNQIEALKEGTATITVTTADGSKTATCVVTVTANTIPVTGVTLDKQTLNLTVGGTGVLVAAIAPENASNQGRTYSSSNTNVATVEGNVVKAVGVGTATITVTTADGNFTAQCVVTVTSGTVEVTSVKFEQPSLTLTEGLTAVLRAVITPSDATNQNVSYKSSNTAVVTVSGNVVRAVAEGTATITVTTEDGNHTANCVVTVVKKYVPGDGKMTADQFKAAIQATKDAARYTCGTESESVKVDATNKVFIVAGGRYALYDETTKQIVKYSPIADIAWEKETLYSDIASFDAAKEKLTGSLYSTLNTFLNADYSTVVYNEDTGRYTLGDTYVTIDDGKVFTFAASGGAEQSLSGYGAEIAVPENLSLVFENVLATKIAKNETAGAKLPVMTGTSTYGLYASDEAADNNVAVAADGYKQTTKQGGTGLETYIVLGLEGDMEGYFELSSSAFGTKWDIIQFISGGAKKFCVNIVDKSGTAKYNLGASNAIADQKAPLTATTIGANTKVRYTLKKATGGNYKLTLTVNGNPFVTDLDIGTDAVDRITLPASNISNGPRNLTINNVIICGTPKSGAAKPVQTIELNKYETRIEQIGGIDELTAIITPADAADKTVKWSSSDTSVATVDSNGVVTAVAKGTAVITATASNGKAVSCTVNVGPKPKATYTVSFISEGKTVDEQTVEKGEFALKPTGVNKAGYILQGWYFDEEGVSLYDFQTPVDGSLTLYAVWKVNEELLVPPPVIPAPTASIEVIRAAGDLEAAYVEWKAKSSDATWFNVYCKVEGGSFEKLDGELIRQYEDGHYRADAVGIKAGTYSLKIVPCSGATENEGASLTVTNMVVKAHERTGYAFVDGSSSGAYNDDGTLKSNALVVYATDKTKDTVQCSGVTGVQNIIGAMKAQKTIKVPVCIRFIGNIHDPAGMPSGDLYLDDVAQLTVEGIGDDAVMNGFGVVVKNSTNVEIRNLGFMLCDSKEGDNVGLQQSNDHVWVHNCDMFYGLAGGDADQAKGDGALDTKKSHHVTHSYNHFWDSGKCNLQGANSGDTSNYITYHHNWYDHSDSRHPRVRVATVHVYNNYYDGNSKYGVGATCGSNIFVENNYFRSEVSMKPMMIAAQGTDAQGEGTFSSDPGGMIKSFGNVYDCTAANLKLITHKQSATDFDCYEAATREEQVPSSYKTKSGNSTYSNFDTASSFYKYKVQSAEDAQVTVMLYAGRVGGGDFKWEFDNSVDDADYGVNAALKAKLQAYKGSISKVNNESVK